MLLLFLNLGFLLRLGLLFVNHGLWRTHAKLMIGFNFNYKFEMLKEHKRKTHVLILGLEGVGKTLLLKKLKGIVMKSQTLI